MLAGRWAPGQLTCVVLAINSDPTCLFLVPIAVAVTPTVTSIVATLTPSTYSILPTTTEHPFRVSRAAVEIIFLVSHCLVSDRHAPEAGWTLPSERVSRYH